PTTITVDIANTGVGNISVLEYGSLTGDTTNFVLGANSASARGGSFIDTGSAIAVNLGFVTNTWTGSNGTNPDFWDVNTTNNWSNTGGSLTDVFLDGDSAVFDDTAANAVSGSVNVVRQGNITAESLTFNNNINDFFLGTASGSEVLTISQGVTATGSGAVDVQGPVSIDALTVDVSGSGSLTFSGQLSGSNGLVKTGTGRAIISAAPDYTGTTNINAGVLEFSGTGIVTPNDFSHVIASGAILEYNTAGANRNDTALDVSGSGTFRKTGSQQFSLISSGSDWALDSGGLIHVEQGIFSFGGGTPGRWQNNLGDMQIDAGATFEGRSTGIRIDVLTGAGTLGIGGKASGEGLREGLTIGADNGSGVFDGVIKNTTNWGGTGAGAYGNQGAVEFAIIKVGTGTQTFNGDNTYTGNTTIQEGQLNINGTNVSTITVNAGANLGGEGSTSGNITFGGNVHTLDIDAGTRAALGSTGTGSLDVSALDAGGFTVNVAGSGGNITVLNYGSGGFSGNINAFALGSSTSGVRGAGGFLDTGSSIVIDLGYVTNTWTGTDASNPTFWDIGTSSNWSNNKDTVFQPGDDAVFDDTATGSTSPTLQSDITAGFVTFNNNTKEYTLSSDNGSRALNSNNGFEFTGAGNVTLNVVLAGNATLTQSGGGTTTLSQSNSYTGTTTISGGTLVTDASDAFGNTGDITFSGGTLQFSSNGTTADYGARFKNSGSAIILDSDGQAVTLSGSIDNTNTGGLTKVGTGTVLITSARNYTGTTTVNEGTLTLRGAAIGATKPYGPIASGATLEFDSTGTTTNGGTITLTGEGTFRKSGTNEFVQTSAGTNVSFSSGGLFHIAEGTYRFGAGGLGNWTANLGDMQIDAEATYQGRASHIIIDTLNGDGTIGIGGTSAAASGVGLRLGVDNGTGVFNGTIQNTNGDGALFTLEKVGSGIQTLNGNNTYTGDTTIDGGLLNINGTNNSTITVNSGANLGGEGSTTGNIIFSGNTHSLDIDAGTTAALSGNLIDVNALDEDGFTINVNGTGSGNITVLNYGAGGFSGNVSAFTLGSNTTSGRGGAGTFVDNGVDAIVINLGFLTGTWVGNNATNPTFWDNGVTTNWNNGSDSLFFDGDDVVFDETASSFTPTLQGNLTVNNATFTSTAAAYTVNDNGGGETLNVTGALLVEDAGNVTFNTVITGSGTFTKSGAGLTIFNGVNTYTGDTSISAGELRFGVNNSISDSSVLTQTGGTVSFANNVVESFHSIQSTGGTFILGTNNGTGVADVTLLNDSRINTITVGTDSFLRLAANKTFLSTGTISQLGTNDSLTFDIGTGAFAEATGSINSGSGDGEVNKIGEGTLRLTGNGSKFGGGTRIENGTLEFSTIIDRDLTNTATLTSSLGDAGGQDVLQIGSDATSATLRMTGSNAKNTSNRSVQIGDAGGTIEVADAAQTLTLNGTVSGNGTSGNGALTTGGAGTLILAGNNTYIGGTTITSGTLLVNNTVGSGTGTGAVIVNSATTIGGSGTIGGAATISGTHSAGSSLANTSVAQQTVSGDLTYSAGATISWDLIANSSSNPGTDFDQFLVGGALDFSGPTSIDLNFDGGSVDWTDSFWDAGQNWTIYSGAASLANASNISIMAEDWMDTNGVLFSTARGLPNGASFSIGASGNDIVLTFNAVPEPSTFTLLGLGLAAFSWGARKRRRKQAAEAVESE
ncbi:MAG: autotransporter-associated beta strand repeat-containing protein, partial [Verrucomicrobiales bacterium]|nr:autotransporter-associated beta strand repeat-containing protein [Verrucomicrobiales bacterium]